MQVMMTVAQIREIKPFRYFTVPMEEISDDWSAYEYVINEKGAYRINNISGEQTYFPYENLWKDYAAEVEGLPDELEVYVDTQTYKAWQDTHNRSIK